jgi:hypothetical protein
VGLRFGKRFQVFKKRRNKMDNLKVGLIAGLVLILVIGACGCATSNPTPTPTAAPTAAPTATTTPTVTATVKPTVKPTATPATSTDSNIVGIEANFVSDATGPPYTIVTHFTKTTVDGKVAYKGVVKDEKGNTFKVTSILTSTQADAMSYADSVAARYKADGFTVKSDNGSHQYVLTKGSTMVGVAGYSVVYGTGSPGVSILEGATGSIA